MLPKVSAPEPTPSSLCLQTRTLETARCCTRGLRTAGQGAEPSFQTPASPAESPRAWNSVRDPSELLEGRDSQGPALLCPGGDYFISGLPEAGPWLLGSAGLDTVPAGEPEGMARSICRAPQEPPLRPSAPSVMEQPVLCLLRMPKVHTATEPRRPGTADSQDSPSLQRSITSAVHSACCFSRNEPWENRIRNTLRVTSAKALVRTPGGSKLHVPAPTPAWVLRDPAPKACSPLSSRGPDAASWPLHLCRPARQHHPQPRVRPEQSVHLGLLRPV